jgi:hypothetical protein
MTGPVLMTGTGAASAGAAGAGAGAGLTAFGIIELVVIGSWIVFFAVLLIFAAVVLTRRGRGQRRRDAQRQRPARPRPARLPAGLDAIRQSDPRFDDQLLLDAALTATLLVFAATTTGDVAPLGRLVTESFWRTPFGRITQLTARDRRREDALSEQDAAAGRQRSRWNIPLDYYPSVPELVSADLGRQQRVGVRVSFGQLQAVVRPGAGDLAAGAAATNFGSVLVSVARTVSSQASNPTASSVSWLASGGQFELSFVRPGDARTGPSAALADRTCLTCGATYQSELAIACQHCQAPRALPWGNWRLDRAVPVG